MAEFFSPTSESDDNSSESSSKIKKKKFDLGKAAVKRKPPESIFSKKQEEPKVERSFFDLGEISQKSKKDHMKELPPVAASDAEAPSDGSLGEEESKAAVKTFVQRRREQIEAEAVDPDTDPEKAAENLAAIQFLKSAEESGDPEAAVAESSEELGVEVEPAPDPITETDVEAEEGTEDADLEEVIEEYGEVGEREEVDAEVSDDEPTELGEEAIIMDRGAETGPEDRTEDDPVAAAAGTPAGPGTATAGTGASTPPAGGGVTPPPFGGPHGPFGGGPGGPGPGGPGGPFGGGFNPNIAPTPAAANTANTTAPQAEIRHGANPATMALVGGIIGYFIGRRRGRKLERREQMKVRRKLEKNVKNLEFDLREKEKRIRRAAVEKVRQQGPAVVETFRTKVVEQTVPTEKILPIAVARAERSRRESRPKAPEAHQLHGSTGHERIGHVLVAAEAPQLINRTEKNKPTREELEKLNAEQTAAAVAGRRVETLNRTELLALSEKVMVGDSSLRQIYETKLIGERGLRRLINEHLRGGDIKKALRQEILEREIDFERDPVLRDLASTGGATVGGGKATLDQMLAQAQLPGTTSEEEAAYYKARSGFEASHHERQQKQRQVLDIALVTIIVLLFGLVLLMLLR